MNGCRSPLLAASRWIAYDGGQTRSGLPRVTIWPGWTVFRWSIMAARVVDFPEPVAPTTSTNPRFVMAMSFTIGGRPSCSTVMDLGFDMPKHQPDVPSLPKDIDTETAELFVVQGEIHFHFFFEFAPLLTAHQRQRQ